jgi:hypothetical protein
MNKPPDIVDTIKTSEQALFDALMSQDRDYIKAVYEMYFKEPNDILEFPHLVDKLMEYLLQAVKKADVDTMMMIQKLPIPDEIRYSEDIKRVAKESGYKNAILNILEEHQDTIPTQSLSDIFIEHEIEFLSNGKISSIHDIKNLAQNKENIWYEKIIEAAKNGLFVSLASKDISNILRIKKAFSGIRISSSMIDAMEALLIYLIEKDPSSISEIYNEFPCIEELLKKPYIQDSIQIKIKKLKRQNHTDLQYFQCLFPSMFQDKSMLN